MKHSCWDCSFLTTIIDSSGRHIELCVFDQSENYLQEVGLCSDDCELDEFAEDLWREKNEHTD